MSFKQTKPPINLMRGWPASSLLPATLLKQAANTVLSSSSVSPSALWYGPDQGYEPLLYSLADWLTTFYRPREPIDHQRLCITGGASQSLGNILAVYTDPSYTRKIWIVAPAYYLAFRIFEDAGFAERMRAVPEDSEGLDLEFLRRGMEQERKRGDVDAEPEYKPHRKRAKVFRHVIYCVPNFANPSSRTMSLRRREGLVKIARVFDALVVCDDVYDMIQWPAEVEDTVSVSEMNEMKTAHLPRLVDVDRELEADDDADGFGNVCSNGSFSKIVAPGARVGWVEGTEKFAYGISQTGTTASGGAPSQLTSTYIHHLVSSGALQNHIDSTLRPAYASRYRTLLSAITSHLVPLDFQLPQTSRDRIGGYFTWLALPPGLNHAAAELSRRSKDEQNLVIAHGGMFEVPGDEEVKFDGHLRLCWAWEDQNMLEEGVKRIAVVAKSMLEERERSPERGYVIIQRSVMRDKMQLDK